MRRANPNFWIIKLSNREVIAGANPGEVILTLWKSTWFAESTKQDFMEGLAARFKIFDGSEIDASTYEAFLVSLEEAGFLELVETGGEER